MGHVSRHFSDRGKPLVRQRKRLRVRQPGHHLFESRLELADLVVGRLHLASDEIPTRHGSRAFGHPRKRSEKSPHVKRDDDAHRQSQRSQHGERPDRLQLSLARLRRQGVDRPRHPPCQYAQPFVGVMLERAERHDRAVDAVTVAAGDGRKESLEQRSVRLERGLDRIELGSEPRRQRARGIAAYRGERLDNCRPGLDDHRAARTSQRFEQCARRAGLALVGDAVHEGR
jgi:hypothetical protein